MRSLFVLVTLTTGAFAQMGAVGLFGILMKKLDNSPQGQCHQLSLFTNIIDLANNPKVVDALTGGDPSKAQMSQALVSILNAQMDPIKANKATVDNCQPTIATDNEVTDCLESQAVTQLNNILANQTAVDAMTKSNPQNVDMLKKLSAALDDKAKAVKANATESGFCDSTVDVRCIGQKIMTQFVKLASDDAALNAHFANNATQVQQFKDGAAKAQTRLDEQRKDEKLTGVCGKMPNILPIDIGSVTLDDLPSGMGIGMGMGM
ncbi:uncharacterized protein BCR38DRAFT_505393 [Pseudomassariella vexata]|uniref:Secreted protein n=1 Tax=Pseudomassariella vexata TaxID=1141098 RepID=A0A1Y2DAX9_9PEZI|nr:uncharacterized protein BCR38DRAFT_505393 [Pseudomassariella vexata]ORY56422.1 hypothetical protein BCR38DRAFT_505393 [Pseudomassariella vexata]